MVDHETAPLRLNAADRAAVCVAATGDLPTEITLTDGGTVYVCHDDVTELIRSGNGGEDNTVDQLLPDSFRAGRTHD